MYAYSEQFKRKINKTCRRSPRNNGTNLVTCFVPVSCAFKVRQRSSRSNYLKAPYSDPNILYIHFFKQKKLEIQMMEPQQPQERVQFGTFGFYLCCFCCIHLNFVTIITLFCLNEITETQDWVILIGVRKTTVPLRILGMLMLFLKLRRATVVTLPYIKKPPEMTPLRNPYSS